VSRRTGKVRLAARHTRAARGVVNVCSGQAVELTEVARLLVEAAGVDVAVERDPALMRRDDPPCVVGDPSRLRTLTGWRPRIALADSLAEQLTEHLALLESATG
jgi:GDP-4-dehydro-6-deoxy-D-mannose reductase